MKARSMGIYAALSGSPLLRKSFAFKFLFVAFIGIHVPLITLIIYQWMAGGQLTSVLTVMLVVLGFTLLSTVATLFVLNQLLRPLIIAKNSLDEYMVSGKVPDLPTHYPDELGLLMSHIQGVIEKMANLISEKGDMVELLSHDLRTPVSRIVGLCTLIELDADTPVTNYTQPIVAEAKSLLALLEDILSILDNPEETGAFNTQPVQLSAIVGDAVAYCLPAAREKDIEIRVAMPANCRVNVERMLFMQVLKNLIGNAIKFTDSGKSIYVSASVDEPGVQLSIKDEGVGFDPQEADRLFDRFTKLSRMGTRGEKSTGLGLSLSRKIIKKHGGHLTAYSAGIGNGTEFVISLPYRHPVKGIIPKGKTIAKNIVRQFKRPE